MSELSKALTEGPRPHNDGTPPRLGDAINTGGTTNLNGKAEPYDPNEVGRALLSGTYNIGIDYVALSFPVRKVFDTNEPFWTTRTSTGQASIPTTLTSEVPMGQSTVTVKYDLRDNGRLGYVSFNPSTVIYGSKSPNAATLPEALQIAHDVLDIVEKHLEIGGPRKDIRLSRLDLCADFSPVTNVQHLLLTANRCVLTPRSKNVCYTSKKGIESVRNQLKKRSVSIYDKSLQSSFKTSMVRIEVSMKRDALRDHCPTFMALTESTCRTMFITMACPWISALAALPFVSLYSIQRSRKDYGFFLRLIGLAYLEESGFAQRMTPTQKKQLRAFKKKYPFGTLNELLVGIRLSASGGAPPV